MSRWGTVGWGGDDGLMIGLGPAGNRVGTCGLRG